MAEIAPDTLIESVSVRERLKEVDTAGVEKLDWPLPPA